jgi:hypothetical protein
VCQLTHARADTRCRCEWTTRPSCLRASTSSASATPASRCTNKRAKAQRTDLPSEPGVAHPPRRLGIATKTLRSGGRRWFVWPCAGMCQAIRVNPLCVAYCSLHRASACLRASFPDDVSTWIRANSVSSFEHPLLKSQAPPPRIRALKHGSLLCGSATRTEPGGFGGLPQLRAATCCARLVGSTSAHRARTHTNPHARVRARTRARAHTHTHARTQSHTHPTHTHTHPPTHTGVCEREAPRGRTPQP